MHTKISMKPHNRKLQVPLDDVPFELPTTSIIQNSNSTSPPPSPSPPPQLTPTPTRTALSQPPQYYSHTDLDSSMALTILVLLTALFFMGFFSYYIRRFSDVDHHAQDLSSYRGTSSSTVPISISPSRGAISRNISRGLEPHVISSLPVYSYYHGDARYQVECAICLGELEERETVKMIPKCEHVFHLECIDTWLKKHVTCPVCRGSQFFHDDGCLGFGGARAQGMVDEGQIERSSAAENGDTSMQMRTLGLRRSNSSYSLGDRVLLQTATSL